MNNPKIKIQNLESGLRQAINTINKFIYINDIKLKYSITLDYKISEYGIFYPEDKHNITINPSQFFDTSREEPHSKYFTADFSIYAVAIHEFCHLISDKYKIYESYKEVFRDKLILNDNSEKNIHEEIGEALRIFFTNPYFLKMISPERFNYFDKMFKSPSPITKKSFIVKWKKWTPQIHQICLERWGIKVLGNRVFQVK